MWYTFSVVVRARDSTVNVATRRPLMAAASTRRPETASAVVKKRGGRGTERTPISRQKATSVKRKDVTTEEETTTPTDDTMTIPTDGRMTIPTEDDTMIIPIDGMTVPTGRSDAATGRTRRPSATATTTTWRRPTSN